MSILRNRDTEEWRPEVFGIVASILIARGVSIADLTALGPEGVDVAEGQTLVAVASGMTIVEAHAARLVLESAGIPAWVPDEAVGIGMRTRLQVRLEDEARAREVLEGSATSEALAEFDEPPCHRCGSSHVRPVVETVYQERPLARPRPVRHWVYECTACGHRWPDEDG